MRYNFNNKRKGSSTVLVILMIVLLVSLSVLSVGISNSGYKLSLRMGEQFRVYYLLESEADRCYSEVLKLDPATVTSESMMRIGCLRPFVDEDRCSFHVKFAERSFFVEFERYTGKIISWYEAEQNFEIKDIELSNFD